MKPRERAVIYTLFGLIAGVNIVILLTQSATPALADFGRLLDELGPADAIILNGDGEAITVRNADGRIAWADGPHGRAYSVGFAHMGGIIPKLMETDQYLDDRERLTESIQAEEQEWQDKNVALQEKYDGVQVDDPAFEEARAEFGQLQAGFQQWQVDANKRVNEMAVSQLAQAYEEIIDAVDVVAERMGIDLVFRFTPTDEALPTGISGQAMLDIRMRPMLRYPEGLDITVDVLEEMALEVE